jgi:hypothetical protein
VLEHGLIIFYFATQKDGDSDMSDSASEFELSGSDFDEESVRFVSKQK